QLDLALGRRAVRGAVLGRLADRRDDLGRAVAENQRTPGEHVVDVLVAVGVPDARAARPGEEAGLPAARLERADRRGHAARGHPLGALEQRLRFGRYCRSQSLASIAW